jgi:hypothetical protein
MFHAGMDPSASQAEASLLISLVIITSALYKREAVFTQKIMQSATASKIFP